MSIKKYTNFEKINQKTDNEGKFIQDKDLFVVSKSEIEDSDFGDCKYDVMEVSVYDINNNLLPQKSGDTVAYIKSGTIKEYVYNVTNTRGKKEVAIDVEKLLDDLGFSNGILRVNFNFIRNRVGDENQLRRAWIQEISATRNEIRIVPLKTTNEFINEQNKKDLDNLSNLNKDFKYYRKAILDSIYSFEGVFMDKIKASLESKYGKDYFNLLRKDFGLRDFDKLATRIYEDFCQSVTYYLTNRNYNITSPAYGLQSGIRFEDCDQYDFNPMVGEMETILRDCISFHTGFLKRRDFNIEETPQEFKAVEQIKEVQNNLDAFQTAQVTVMTNFPIPPIQPTPMPPQITVPTAGNFYYTLKNNKNSSTIKFVFIDASGQKVEKSLGPGRSFTICAKEGTVSVASSKIDELVKGKGLTTLDDVKSGISKNLNAEITLEAGGVDKKMWDIIKGKACNTVDIRDNAPTLIPEITDIKPTKTTVSIQTVSGGGSGIVATPTISTGFNTTRDTTMGTAGMIRVGTSGFAVSTATAAGMSEGIGSLQPTTTTDVRQTTLGG